MRTAAAVALVVSLIAYAPGARPCGALFRTETDQNLALDAQRALYVLRPSTIEIHLQMRAATGGAGFAWVVPVPASPTLSLGDAEVFDALERMTLPSVEIVSHGDDGGGGLCAGDALKGDGGLNGRNDGVQHFGGGTLGDYTYDLIGGNNAEAIAGWLEDNGYAVPAAFADAIAPYAGSATFVAVKLTPGSEDVVDLDPLVVTVPRPFETTITYPLGLARLSTGASQPVVLWVLADKRYRVANFASAELGAVAKEMRDQVERGDTLSYADAVTALTEASNGRLAITEYARDLASETTSVEGAVRLLVDDDAHYLTRLYMDVPADALQDLVVTFAANAPDVAPFATAEGPQHLPTSAACVALALLIVARRRRR